MSSDACSDVCSPAVTVLLPTVDDGNEKTTKKGRRKGSKGKNDDNWRYCVPNCLHSGKSPNERIQCHLCQPWIHPECVGEDSKDIVGILDMHDMSTIARASGALGRKNVLPRNFDRKVDIFQHFPTNNSSPSSWSSSKTCASYVRASAFRQQQLLTQQTRPTSAMRNP